MGKDLKQLILNIDETGSNWDTTFLKALKSNDISTIFDLLINADNIYMDEYFITSSIDNFTKKDKNIDSILTSLKNNIYIRNIIIDDSTLKFKYKNQSINLGVFSEIIPNVKKLFPEIETDERKGKCHNGSINICKVLGIPCELVTGIVYGLSNKSTYIHSWIETILNNKEVVIDYTLNCVINKDAFYFLNHANPISKITDIQLLQDSKYIKVFSSLNIFNNKEYLLFRNEIINSIQKNEKLFDEER